MKSGDKIRSSSRRLSSQSAGSIARISEGDVLVDARGLGYRVAAVELSPGNGDGGELTVSLLALGASDLGFAAGTTLTRRETEVARLLACRATIVEIGEALGMSSHTARNHIRRVLEKLDVRSKSDVRYRWLVAEGRHRERVDAEGEAAADAGGE